MVRGPAPVEYTGTGSRRARLAGLSVENFDADRLFEVNRGTVVHRSSHAPGHVYSGALPAHAD
jgi:hypothetical protein